MKKNLLYIYFFYIYSIYVICMKLTQHYKSTILNWKEKKNFGCCMDNGGECCKKGAGMPTWWHAAAGLLWLKKVDCVHNFPKATCSGLRLVGWRKPWCEYLYQINLQILQIRTSLPVHPPEPVYQHWRGYKASIGDQGREAVWSRVVTVEVKGSGWIWKVIYRWNQQEVLTGWIWDGVVKVRRESVVGRSQFWLHVGAISLICFLLLFKLQ